MSILLPDYNPEQIESSSDLLPAGLYQVSISHAERRESANSGNGYLSIEYTIEGPSHANRKLWDTLVFWPADPNSKALNMANVKRKGIGIAIGHVGWNDPDQIMGLRLLVDVQHQKGKQKADGTFWDDKENIKAYKPDPMALQQNTQMLQNRGIDSAMPVQATPTQQTQANGAPNWGGQ